MAGSAWSSVFHSAVTWGNRAKTLRGLMAWKPQRSTTAVSLRYFAPARRRLKGRLIAILLTGGEAHDCPVAERLINRVEPAERMLGDKAYGSNELRDELQERGTKPVIPN